MKIRNGFVSNSSSSSFILSKICLSEQQIQAVLNPQKYINEHFIKHQSSDDTFISKDTGRMYNFGYPEQRWVITEDENVIQGHTYIDNFDMMQFFEYLRIPEQTYNFRD